MTPEDFIRYLEQRRADREKVIANYDFELSVIDKHLAAGRRGHLTALRKLRIDALRARKAITG